MRWRGSAVGDRLRQGRAAMSFQWSLPAIVGGVAALAVLVVSVVSTGTGVPISDMIVTGLAAALVARFPRALVGTAVGVAIALAFKPGGSAWEIWKQVFPAGWWGSIGGLALYRLGDLALLVPIMAREAAVSIRERLGERATSGFLSFSLRSQAVLRRPDSQAVLLIGGALLYALARTSTDGFYGAFGVTPEEVNITTQSLLVSAGVVTAGLALAVVVSGLVLRLALRHSASRLLVFVVVPVAAVLSDRQTPLSDVFYALPVPVVVWYLSSRWDGWNRAIGWRWLGVLAAVLAMSAVAVAGAVRDSAVRAVVHGEASRPHLGPFLLSPFYAPTVEVWPLEGADVDPALIEAGCVSYLGSGDGMTVLADDRMVWRIPTERVLLTEAECP